MPAAASAADTYVDQEAGDDTNACTSPGLGACEHIGGPAGAIAKAGSGDTIHVADPATATTYAESLSLTDGKSLVADSADATETIIDNGAAASAAVAMNSTGRLTGFTIRSDFAPVTLGANGRVTGNVFDDTTFPSLTGAAVQIAPSAPNSTVHQNTFTDDQTGTQTGVAMLAAGSPAITSNVFVGLNAAIVVSPPSGQATPVISLNDISGSHDNGSAGFGISLDDEVNATVADNVIHDPEAGALTFGIALSGNPATAGVAGGTLRRNRVLGYLTAVVATDTDAAVTMDSDVLTATGFSLRTVDNGANGGADVTATNITAYDNGVIQLVDTALTLNSSIVEGAISAGTGSATATCAISFSRGPATVPGSNGCQDFQTTADPSFVAPGAANYRLAPGSAMIEAGDPSDPAPGSFDNDGNSREIDGDDDFVARRDMGAFEFPDVVAPTAQITSGPSGGATTGPTPTFAFSSNDPSASFTCRVDGDPFAACSGPGASNTTAPLSPGSHTFEVRATDAAAIPNTGAPSSASFVVEGSPPGADADPPETTIVKGPKRKIKNRSARFEFASDETGAAFECSLDGAAFAACTSPLTLKKLKRRRHAFAVRAVDSAGNVDATPAEHRFKVKKKR